MLRSHRPRALEASTSVCSAVSPRSNVKRPVAAQSGTWCLGAAVGCMSWHAGTLANRSAPALIGALPVAAVCAALPRLP